MAQACQLEGSEFHGASGNRVDAVVERAPRKVVGGLELIDGHDENNRYSKGKVISVGNLVEGINNGDTVFYDKHAGHNIDLDDNTRYFVLKAGDIVIVE